MSPHADYQGMLIPSYGKMCKRCGALITPDGMALHDEWHERMTRSLTALGAVTHPPAPRGAWKKDT